ncbi:Hypothetical protein CINCED_3A018781 [Cinara cedri]|uniref:Uncharacterized protein n=1 Tax=Cinara cedri TaxID=506608 RepID=A0A5E4N856_9HEMI|nr:Hypothetical protein CINCED_3A018781 [Cinara cedri]
MRNIQTTSTLIFIVLIIFVSFDRFRCAILLEFSGKKNKLVLTRILYKLRRSSSPLPSLRRAGRKTL